MEYQSSLESGDYVAPAYEFPDSVTNLKLLPRFGHGCDVTVVFSSSHYDQVDYAAGLITLFAFLLMFFMFWTMMIITFKVMGPANAGFLSGYHFVVPDPADDVKNIGRRPFRVRVVFLIATAFLMLFAYLLVDMGLTNVNNATRSMIESLNTTGELLGDAEDIAQDLGVVGDKAIEIRNDTMNALNNLCPANPNITDLAGVDIMDIAHQAKSDLTMLANFIRDGLETLNKNLSLLRIYTNSVSDATHTIEFWDWQMKLLCSGLFILPLFLVAGVCLVLLELDVKPYQHLLTYFFMPLFTITIIASFIVCCAMLPVSAVTADACSGGGVELGGPDDTVLTVYRHLMGNNGGNLSNFVGYYTQQCDVQYYPFDFLSIYLTDLDKAIESTDIAIEAIGGNQDLLVSQCGRKFDNVLNIVKEMNSNLRLLKRQADLSRELVKCETINSLYVNTIHEAGCTYSVNAMAWIFASTLIISVCGLIMIMLRSAYYSVEHLEPRDPWKKKLSQSMMSEYP